MRDPWFERALILLCQHNEEGAIGVIINREGDVDLQEVIDKLTEDHGEFGESQTAPRAWWGGRSSGAGFVIFSGTVDDGEGWNVGVSRCPLHSSSTAA